MKEKGKLVLGVKEGQSVTIGDDITITVLDSGKSKISILFIAPKETKIMRSGYKGDFNAEGDADF